MAISDLQCPFSKTNQNRGILEGAVYNKGGSKQWRMYLLTEDLTVKN